MKMVSTLLLTAALALGAPSALANAAAAPAAPMKIWQPPAYTTLAQAVIDRVWAAHKDEMIGITFHAIPPGMKRYAMIAGTWPDRVGKASAEDDIMSAEEGFIILNPAMAKMIPNPNIS